MFKRMNRDRMFEQVSHEIKKQIYKGILKPGDKMPPETELARSFNVSRQTIRESMRILELSGFISIKRGVKGGPIIENTVSNRVSEALSEAIQMGPATIDDLIVAWREIGKLILIQATKNADEDDIQALRENVAKAKKKLDQATPVFLEGIRFHEVLARASKNHIFQIVSGSILAVYSDFLSRLEPSFEAAQKIIEIQKNIIAAIVEKKEQEAIDLFEEYSDFVKERLKSIGWPNRWGRNRNQLFVDLSATKPLN